MRVAAATSSAMCSPPSMIQRTMSGRAESLEKLVQHGAEVGALLELLVVAVDDRDVGAVQFCANRVEAAKAGERDEGVAERVDELGLVQLVLVVARWVVEGDARLVLSSETCARLRDRRVRLQGERLGRGEHLEQEGEACGRGPAGAPRDLAPRRPRRCARARRGGRRATARPLALRSGWCRAARRSRSSTPTRRSAECSRCAVARCGLPVVDSTLAKPAASARAPVRAHPTSGRGGCAPAVERLDNSRVSARPPGVASAHDLPHACQRLLRIRSTARRPRETPSCACAPSSRRR